MGPPWGPRILISGPNRGIFSKLNVPGPLGSGGHSRASFSIGRFWVAQRTLQYDVPPEMAQKVPAYSICWDKSELQKEYFFGRKVMGFATVFG